MAGWRKRRFVVAVHADYPKISISFLQAVHTINNGVIFRRRVVESLLESVKEFKRPVAVELLDTHIDYCGVEEKSWNPSVRRSNYGVFRFPVYVAVNGECFG